MPLYAFLLTTLAGEPALCPTRQGRLQGGTPPASRAAMIWLVMVSRTCCWLAMLASGSVVVGYQRPARRCREIEGASRADGQTVISAGDGRPGPKAIRPGRFPTGEWDWGRGGEALKTEAGPDARFPTPPGALSWTWPESP